MLFDGVCNFCNASVQFIIKRDRRAYFKFASLQSEFANTVVGDRTLPMPESVILIENGEMYERSTAALKIARRLNGLWPVFYIFILVPRPVRDAVYHIIARNRYRWFGKRESCMIPGKELKGRFLEV